MKRTVILIGNPAAGKNALKSIEKAGGIIKSGGFDVRLMLTEKRGDAEAFARQVSSEFGVHSLSPRPPLSGGGQGGILIITAGGDGTFNEVINGIAGSEIPMAILPLGTTNVLAKELNIPEDADKALDIALNGNEHKICLGKITLSGYRRQDARCKIEDRGRINRISGISHQSSELSRYFLLMAGIGFDGRTVYGIKGAIKKFSGKGAYIWSGLSALLKWNPEKLIFNIDGKTREGYSAIVCNASKYAGNFNVAPDAKLNEPYLYAFIMHGKRRLNLIKYVSAIIRGRHMKLSDITYQRAEQIEIQGNAHIQIDGDYLGKTPASIEIIPDVLNLVY